MALEQFVNNGASTLVAAMNGSSDPVTFDVTDPSVYPPVPNFRVRIDTEILLVTAVAGATFTASRAQEGTGIQSHLISAPVNFTVTRGSLFQLLGEMNLAGVFSTRPAAGMFGRRFTPTDYKGVSYYDDGTAWKIVLPSGQIVTPPSTSILGSWINQESATYSTVQDFIRFTDPAGNSSGEDVRYRYKNVTFTTDVTITMCIGNFDANSYALVVYGFGFRNSTNSNIGVGGLLARPNEPNLKDFTGRYSDPNNFGGDSTERPRNYTPGVIFVKAKWTASSSNLDVYTSLDGVKWMHTLTQNMSSLGTVDQAGIAFNNYNNSSANDVTFDIYSLSIVEN